MYNRNGGRGGGAFFKVGVTYYTYLNTTMNANKHGGGRGGGHMIGS